MATLGRHLMIGEPPDLERVDYREPGWRRWLRGTSYAFNAGLAAWERPAEPAAPRDVPWSGFYDVPARELRVLGEILGRLAEAARGKRVAVVLVPGPADIARYRQSGESDPLSRRLAGVAARHDIELVNLLPALAGDLRAEGGYFHRCDYHWNALGHRVAAEHTLRRLRDGFYRDQPRNETGEKGAPGSTSRWSPPSH